MSKKKNYRLLILSDDLQVKMKNSPETKMGCFQTGYALLKNQEKYTVEIDMCKYLFYVEGYMAVPFSVDDITDIVITHEKIDIAIYNRMLDELEQAGYFSIPCNNPKGCSLE